MFNYTLAYFAHLKKTLKSFIYYVGLFLQFISISVPLLQIFLKPSVWIYNAIIAVVMFSLFLFNLIADRQQGKGKNAKAKKQKKIAKKIAKAIKTISQIFIIATLGYSIYCTEQNPSILSYLPLAITAVSVVFYFVSLLITSFIEKQLELFVDALETDFFYVVEPVKNVKNFIYQVAGHTEEVDTEPTVTEKNKNLLDGFLLEYRGEKAMKKEQKKVELALLARDFFKGFFRSKWWSKKTTEPKESLSEAPVQPSLPQENTPKRQLPERSIAEEISESLPMLETPESEASSKKKRPLALEFLKKPILSFPKKSKKEETQQLQESPSVEQTPEESLTKV